MPSSKDLIDLNFLKFESNGRPYVRAYKNRWEPAIYDETGQCVKKGRSAPKRQKHVGALRKNGLVELSDSFLATFPQFAGFTWYYHNNELLDEDSYFALQEELSAQSNEVEVEQDEGDDSTKETISIPDGEEKENPDDLFWLSSYAIMNLAREMGIEKSLTSDEFAPKEVKQLMGLIIYQLLGSNNSSDSFDTWAYRQLLPKAAKRLDGKSISTLLKKISQKEIDNYFLNRYKETEKARTTADGKAPIRYCAFDSTSINTYADIGLSAMGHAKQDEGLKQVNLAMVYDRFTGEVIYAFIYDGSINDVSSYQYIVKRMEKVGFPVQNLLWVTDRGYHSNENLTNLINEGIPFLSAAPIGKGTKEEQLVIKLAPKLKLETMYCLPEISLNGYTETEVWRLKDGRTKKVYIHVYVDLSTYADEMQNLGAKVFPMLQALNNGEKIDDHQWNTYKSCFTRKIDPESNPHMKPRYIWSINNTELSRRTDRAGFFIIKSDCVSDPVDAYLLYKNRGQIEEGFKQLKNPIGGRRFHSGESTYMGRLFVKLIATCLRMKILFNFNDQNKNPSKKRIPGDSLAQLFMKLDKVMMHRHNDDNPEWLSDPVPKATRELLTIGFGLKHLPKTLTLT